MELRVPYQHILINNPRRWHGFPLRACLCCSVKWKKTPTHWHLPVTESQTFYLPLTPSSSQSVSVSRNISHECHFSFTKEPSVQLKASRQLNSKPHALICSLRACTSWKSANVRRRESPVCWSRWIWQTEVDAHILYTRICLAVPQIQQSCWSDVRICKVLFHVALN